MDGKAPDVVFTDPPYGIDVVSGSKSFGSVGGSNVVAANNYSPIIGDSTTETAKSFYLACKELGFKNFIVWGGNYFTDFLPPKKCWLVWDKKGRKWGDNFSDFEMAWTSFDKPAKILTHVWMGMVQSGEREARVHPTQKPANLVIDCLEHLQIGSKVFDGFGGSGSTLIACEKSNRTCYMMELDPKYCDVIIKRWENLTGLKAELLNATR
jgi:site-specific DNA-methyltransferase (adenine-specific)